MKKQTTTKIISKLIIFVFVVSFFQFTSPIQAATDTSMSNLYSNPNQGGNNTYKFKISDVVSSQMLTNIVGCTGVVNKTATWMAKFIQSPAQQAKLIADKIKKVKEGLKSACLSGKAASEVAGDSIPIIGGIGRAIDTIFSKIKFELGGGVGEIAPCLAKVDATEDELWEETIKQTDQDAERNFREQCFDGIAITLAKNQLTSMTRSMMNWVNSGYGGNPFFVQNMQDFTYNIERNVVETGIDILLSPGNQNPYAYDFSRSVITGRGLLSGSSNFLGGLQSDLEAFIVSPQSYYSDDQLDQAMNTEEALLRAQRANYEFANDFAVGGWNGWLALTQRDQNNPLGFTMLASQYLADTQMQKVTEAKDELAQNSGFMSQKTCDEWQVYSVDGKPESVGDGTLGLLPVYKNTPPDICYKTGGDCCVHWKTITPGSIIKEKTTNYLNSPERQLELADTINESLNALFSILLSKLEGGGLMGLSDGELSPINWNDNLNELASPDGNTPYSNNGAYDGFNLTRDLGNNYIYSATTNLGTWNANTNTATLSDKANETYPKEINTNIKLYPGTAPEIYTYNSDNKEKELASPINPFYTVTVAGKTKLINEGYNGWEVGDRAFWNGKEWQNWKKGQVNPIKKRGVIQVQQDYIVAGKEILGVLPNVMTNLGELDYCLPGPNPSYKTNSTDAQSAYQDWIGSMYVGRTDSTGERWGVKIDQEGKDGKPDDRTYANLANIYTDNPGVWNLIKSGMQPLIVAFSNICHLGFWDFSESCTGNYFYSKSLNQKETENLQEKTDLMDKTLDTVNNHLFQDFYKVFDERMNKLYFNNMVNKYNETEISSALIPNTAYIPMAESGLDLTKNILYYNDDITKAMQDYTDAMAQAKINIAKLEPIKTEVSGIIKAAQDRRNKELVTKLGLSLSEIQTKYATCFAEENIKFYDADEITNMGSYDAERCDDEIDNDLNGLVDKFDPVCPGYVAPRRN